MLSKKNFFQNYNLNSNNFKRNFIKTKRIRKEIIKAGQDVSEPDFGR